MKCFTGWVLGAALFASGAAVQAQPCLDNFTSEGNALLGKKFKTSVTLPSVALSDTLARVAKFTADNGFTILMVDKDLGLISATQSGSGGRSTPLNVSLQTESGATRIMMTYATPAGVFSPEDAIKRHFCLTAEAAARGLPSPPANRATSASGGSTAPTLATNQVLKGYAVLTPFQEQSIATELAKLPSAESVRNLVSEAAPAIRKLLERMACVADTSGVSALNEFAAPGTSLSDFYIVMRPMRSARYHDNASCMTVTRIHGWSAPALNALQFEVIYRADDSGETSKLTHEAVRQPDGVWLFRR